MTMFLIMCAIVGFASFIIFASIQLEIVGCISLIIFITCLAFLPLANDAKARAEQLSEVNIKAKHKCISEGYTSGHYNPSTGKRVCEIYKSF